MDSSRSSKTPILLHLDDRGSVCLKTVDSFGFEVIVDVQDRFAAPHSVDSVSAKGVLYYSTCLYHTNYILSCLLFEASLVLVV